MATNIEIRNVIVNTSGSGISADSTDILTNKTLDSYTNYIHADGIHYRVKATEAIAYGDRLSFVGFNAGEQAIWVKVRDSLTEPVIALAHDTMISGAFGMAVFNGLFKNLDTSSYTEGSILYDNGAGGFTTTPTINDTNYNQAIAYVVRSHALNGEIMLNIGHGHERSAQISYGNGSVKYAIDSLNRDIVGEIPSGTMNGINTNFSIIHIPIKSEFYLNGLRMKVIDDYTLTSNTLSLVSAPHPGDILLADYTY